MGSRSPDAATEDGGGSGAMEDGIEGVGEVEHGGMEEGVRDVIEGFDLPISID